MSITLWIYIILSITLYLSYSLDAFKNNMTNGTPETISNSSSKILNIEEVTLTDLHKINDSYIETIIIDLDLTSKNSVYQINYFIINNLL